MQERRLRQRYAVSFPVRVEWIENGQRFTEEGLTENVGLKGVLVYLPQKLPEVGSEVDLIVTEHSKQPIHVKACVLRLERNVSHPKCALMLNEVTKDWEEKVWLYASQIVAEQSEDSVENDE
ncbi:MAG: PilZ domain-containing protein [Pyrinomonadaceae bacterium]|nr:PilZ domain-containing protein [Pyrinomonadaceae bacterium]MCX7639562.1 PilZ domain-containing protein [Pyrinomonadaceae bacterium]MDW8303955.1 PilZ domain-containing protein [Acidobacteriota bacterium]